MEQAELKQLIDIHPDRGELPIPCVLAVCYVESSFNEWACRYEPGYRWIPDDLSATERMCQMTSWGLMQVMGGVAREYGMTGDLTKLCLPTIGLKYGMMHLRRFFDKYKNWTDALASYNGGSPRKNPEGKLINQSYVDKVLKAWASYEVPLPLKETEA